MKCIARNATICIVNQHDLALQANKPNILKACNQMKNLGPISNDRPTQIITNVMATISHEIHSYLSQKQPLRQQIKGAKRVCGEVGLSALK